MRAEPSEARAQRPPAPIRRGTKQTGVRLYNERLVLSLVRQHGALPRASIARLTGLSPPTVSEIVRRLEADRLLRREALQRGRIGQPSTPLSLDPDGAFAIGVKVGRRSCDILLMDFAGTVRHELHHTYPYPSPAHLLDLIGEGCSTLARRLSARERARIAGIGIAMPFELWRWEEEVGAPPGAMQAWQAVDLRADVARISEFPVYLCNDATAGCAAVHLFGHATAYPEFLYVFIAWFIGGGVVIDGNLFPGRSGYAGSLGQMLVPAGCANGRPVMKQLLHCASIYVLAKRVAEAGDDPRPIWESDDWQGIAAAHLDEWIDDVADGIAHALVAAGSVIDFQAAIIDGAMPPAIRGRIVPKVAEKFDRLERKGLPDFDIVEGTIGYRARAIGGASLPFLAKFTRDRELLFRDPEEGKTPDAAPLHAARLSAF
jgi:predicted NBD/HSP70 family sugar kinase